MLRPGFELGSPGWEPGILTSRPPACGRWRRQYTSYIDAMACVVYLNWSELLNIFRFSFKKIVFGAISRAVFTLGGSNFQGTWGTRWVSCGIDFSDLASAGGPHAQKVRNFCSNSNFLVGGRNLKKKNLKWLKKRYIFCRVLMISCCDFMGPFTRESKCGVF